MMSTGAVALTRRRFKVQTISGFCAHSKGHSTPSELADGAAALGIVSGGRATLKLRASAIKSGGFP